MFPVNRRTAAVAAVAGALTLSSTGVAFAAAHASKADIKADVATVKRDKAKLDKAKSKAAKAKVEKKLDRAQRDLKADRAGH